LGLEVGSKALKLIPKPVQDQLCSCPKSRVSSKEAYIKNAQLTMLN